MNKRASKIRAAKRGQPRAAERSGRIQARSVPAEELVEGSGTGGCSACVVSVKAGKVWEALEPSSQVATQRVLLMDAQGKGWEFIAPKSMMLQLNEQRSIEWELSLDPGIGLPLQKAWMETTFEDSKIGRDNITILQ